jgi:hypothetical protein
VVGAGNLVQISPGLYDGAAGPSTVYAIHREYGHGDRVDYHSVQRKDIGMLIRKLVECSGNYWLVLFDDKIVEVPEEYYHEAGNVKWLVPANI